MGGDHNKSFVYLISSLNGFADRPYVATIDWMQFVLTVSPRGLIHLMDVVKSSFALGFCIITGHSLVYKKHTRVKWFLYSLNACKCYAVHRWIDWRVHEWHGVDDRKHITSSSGLMDVLMGFVDLVAVYSILLQLDL